MVCRRSWRRRLVWWSEQVQAEVQAEAGGSGWVFTAANLAYTSSTYTGGTWGLGSQYYLESGAYTVAGNSPMPTHDRTNTMIGNSGDGFARITMLEVEVEYTGSMQQLTIPQTGTYKLEMWGAARRK